jgi:hypothetical protein
MLFGCDDIKKKDTKIPMQIVKQYFPTELKQVQKVLKVVNTHYTNILTLLK